MDEILFLFAGIGLGFIILVILLCSLEDKILKNQKVIISKQDAIMEKLIEIKHR